MAEREEVDDLIDSSQKLIPPEVSLQGQRRGEFSDREGVNYWTPAEKIGGFPSFRLRDPPPKVSVGRTKTSYFQDGPNHILFEIL